MNSTARMMQAIIAAGRPPVERAVSPPSMNGKMIMADAITVPDNIERSVHDAESLFEQASIARAEAENAEAYAKQIRALQFVRFKDDGCSAAEAEQRAMASPEYRQASKDWMDKNITWRTLEGKARGKELRFEAWRTMNATERAKMNLR